MNIQIYSSKSINLIHFHKIDEREPIEMNAGACLNAKCTEYIDYDSIKIYPTKCQKCNELITKKNYQQFKEILNTTKTHLDSLKSSSVACKISISLKLAFLNF